MSELRLTNQANIDCFKVVEIEIEIEIEKNSLFDTPKTANSFLGPRKLNIPYLTLLQTFHFQYDIPSMPGTNSKPAETLENHSKL